MLRRSSLSQKSYKSHNGNIFNNRTSSKAMSSNKKQYSKKTRSKQMNSNGKSFGQLTSTET